MKKLILALILIALIVGALAACGGPSYLEEFNELIEEIEQLREYRFESTAVISLDAAFLGDTAFAFADFMPMHFAIDGTVSDINRQMQATYRHRQADGTLMFDMSMLLTDQHMYVGLVSMVDYMLRPVFEVLGVDMDRFSAEALLGGYAYLIVPYAGRLEDMVFTPAALTDGVEIEPFLARQGNAFVITALGEDVRALTDGISSLLAQFIMPDATLDGADAIGDVISDISAQLTGTNLAEARVVIVTAHEENSFHQTVELQVPGFIDLRANFSLTAQGVAPVAVPGNALTETEFANLLLQTDFDELFGYATGRIPTSTEEIQVVTHLTDLILVGHSVGEHSLLTAVPLRGQAGEHMVLGISGGTVTAEDFHLIVDADAMEMYYISLTGMDAVEAVIVAVEADRQGYFLPDSTLTFSALSTNEARTIALLAVAEQTAAGMTRICLYLSQMTSAGDVIRLELVFYMDLFTDTDHAILAELSSHIGVDLSAYITGLLA